MVTVNFFVRVEQEREWSGNTTILDQCAYRVERDRDPCFHVVNARPIEPALFFTTRHRLQRAGLPHGIEMPEQQDRLAFVPRPGTLHRRNEICLNDVSGFTSLVDP